MSVIANVVGWFAAVLDDKIHFVGQVKIRLISQLTKDISRVLQKLLRYFNDTIILILFLPLSLLFDLLPFPNI